MSITISDALAVRLQRMLAAYGMASTYTHRPRTGGVLKGCPRGPQVTPERLAFNVRMLDEQWKEEVAPQWRKRRAQPQGEKL